MSRASSSWVAIALAATLAGCGTLGPKAEREPPRRRAPPALPATTGAGTARAGEGLARAVAPPDAPAAVAPPWQDFVQDAALRALVEAALAHNRDLRVAAANVQRAAAAVDASRAAALPQVGVGAAVQRAPNALGREANALTAGVQLAAWEIDLFGRLAADQDAARATLAASQAGRRAAEVSVVAAVLQTALAERTDRRFVALARRTLEARDETLRLVTLRERQGYASLIELDAQRALVAQSRAALAQAERAQAQNRHALALLLGRPLEALQGDATGRAAATPAASSGAPAAQALAALPVGDALDDAVLRPIAGGVDSSALWARPDVMQAEAVLAQAEASVRAARATLWPSLTLTGNAGQVAPTLAAMLRGGTFVYTLAANAAWSIFDGGRRHAGVAVADASREAALAQYEKALQSAFRDTADALVAVDGWREQVRALADQATAARSVSKLTDLKFQHGAAGLLERLEAQRGLVAAEQALLQAQLAELSARVAVWKALGR